MKKILVAGFFAGSLDLVAAVLVYFVKGGTDPLRIFQYIASAVFGKEAFSGGWVMGGLGILFHFIIAYFFTIFFFFLYKRWSAPSKNILITAILYGAFIWVMMNLVILRFTKVSIKPLVTSDVLVSISILVIAIGLPITLIAQKHYTKSDSI